MELGSDSGVGYQWVGMMVMVEAALVKEGASKMA